MIVSHGIRRRAWQAQTANRRRSVILTWLRLYPTYDGNCQKPKPGESGAFYLIGAGMEKMDFVSISRIVFSQIPFSDSNQLERLLLCPGCVYEHPAESIHYNHYVHTTVNTSDNYEAWAGRGECIRVRFTCENGHTWELCFGFHKGEIFSWIEWARDRIDYHEYIRSDEWKARAAAAKKAAGNRCQMCNKAGNNGGLHAHHRTYENLGNEQPGDITVLCADCHAKFHDKAGG